MTTDMNIRVRRLGVNMVGALCLVAILSGAAVAPDAPLADAAMRGDLEAVRSLLDSGADVNAAQGDGMSALHWAATRGDFEIAELLIAAGADVAAASRIGSYTPLHMASKGGHAAIAKALIEAGADVTVRTTNSEVTPLHLAAASRGGEAVVAVLLEHGADPNALEVAAGQTPLMFAAANNRAASVRALLNGGATAVLTTRVVDVLSRVAADREASGVLNETLGEFRRVEGGGPEWQPTPAQMQAAIEAQRKVVVAERVVEDKSTLITRSMKQAFGVRSVPQDRLPIREVLVGKTGGLTALLHAARVGHVEAAMALLNGGADVNQVSVGDGSSPLLIATLNGHWDLALTLLGRGADPNRATMTDGAAPLFAVLQTQWAPTTMYPQPRALDLQTAEYMEIVTALLEAGADPNAGLKTNLWHWEYNEARLGTNLTGATPFWRATYAQDLGAMKLLVANGADPHLPTLTPPIEMRQNRAQDGRQEDSFSGNEAPHVPEGAPAIWPIHGAAGGGYLGIGAYTVSAVPGGFMPAVQYLVEQLGADVNAVDWWGYRPLHYAASRGDDEMIQYLVSRGADISLLTRMGQSVADMARGGQAGFFMRVEYPETVELTQSLGSPMMCLHVNFSGTGTVCPGAGKTDFEEHLTDWEWRYKRTELR